MRKHTRGNDRNYRKEENARALLPTAEKPHDKRVVYRTRKITRFT